MVDKGYFSVDRDLVFFPALRIDFSGFGLNALITAVNTCFLPDTFLEICTEIGIFLPFLFNPKTSFPEVQDTLPGVFLAKCFFIEF